MKASSMVLICLLLFTACNRKEQTEKKAASDVFYTCSMHPQVKEAQPGKCPICHMSLIAIKKNTAVHTGDLQLTAQQIALGNIRIDTIQSGTIGDEMILAATLTIDQNTMSAVSARVSGRIDHLYYKNIGDYVAPGAPLYELYSEQLNNAKQEYVASLEKKELLDNTLIDFDRLIAAAKNKLLLWGMSQSQISQLAKNRKFNPITTMYSTAGGYITSLDVLEGGYVNEGEGIVKLAGLSSLWAEAQLYSTQRSNISDQASAEVSFPDLPGRKVNAKISFENPELSPDSRINLIRVTVPNAGNQLRPGMQAYVTIKSSAKVLSLYLPVDAVLRGSKGASVWVSTAKNIFRNKMVTVGAEDGQLIEIKSGLQNGDMVVISGAYLINSEYIFKQGSEPMAGMEM